jgi:hypothetical protein
MAGSNTIMGQQTLGYGMMGAGVLVAASSFVPSAVNIANGSGIPSAGFLVGGLAIAGGGAAMVLSSK